MKAITPVHTPPNRDRVLSSQIVTLADLADFKIELLADFKKLLRENRGQPTKKWLKSHEVRKLLDISPGTLQHLRVNGTLPFTKIGSVIFYDYDDIQAMLQNRKFKPINP
jgi:hypothetical protein